MTHYTDYHLNPVNYPFLKIFQKKWLEIKAEYLKFITDGTIDHSLINTIMTPRTSTIKAKEPNSYKALGLLFHGKSFLQLIDDYRLTWEGMDKENLMAYLAKIELLYFQKTLACIAQANKLANNIIRNVHFSVFAPGLDIKCHVNYNPHSYRAYLGLLVPKGEVAMKICGETLYWHEGKTMVLDHIYPHCPHNYTQEPRIALIMDFLKPEKSRSEMLAIENDILKKRMQENPYGLGIFGDDDFVSEEDLTKYGFGHQKNWVGNLV